MLSGPCSVVPLLLELLSFSINLPCGSLPDYGCSAWWPSTYVGCLFGPVMSCSWRASPLGTWPLKLVQPRLGCLCRHAEVLYWADSNLLLRAEPRCFFGAASGDSSRADPHFFGVKLLTHFCVALALLSCEAFVVAVGQPSALRVFSHRRCPVAQLPMLF